MSRQRAAWICMKAELEEGLLTDWERQFLDSIQYQLARSDTFEPSERQLAALERISEKVE